MCLKNKKWRKFGWMKATKKNSQLFVVVSNVVWLYCNICTFTCQTIIQIKWLERFKYCSALMAWLSLLALLYPVYSSIMVSSPSWQVCRPVDNTNGHTPHLHGPSWPCLLKCSDLLIALAGLLCSNEELGGGCNAAAAAGKSSVALGRSCL